MHYTKKAKSSSNIGMIGTFLVFLLVLVMLAAGTQKLANAASSEGVAATRQAIERASVLCYATEGFYPPGLTYIEKNYGIQVDYARYAVRYEVQASNIMPVILVTPR